MQLAGIVVFCVILAISAAENRYTTKYDNVNIETILGNERVLNNYIKCLMEEGPCTPEGRELKKTLPDALASGCTKCNEKQKQTAEKVIKYLQVKKNRDWERLTKKYDPQGEYKKRFDAHVTASRTA